MIFRVLLFLFIIITACPAFAAELLIFRDHAKGIREEQVIADLATEKHLDASLPFEIAPIDLNGDGVDEWIVRQKPSPTCAAESACRFIVSGLREKKPVLLGAFEAGKVGISGEKQYGVRKLLVYNKKSDDFAFSVYVWNPYESGFEPE